MQQTACRDSNLSAKVAQPTAKLTRFLLAQAQGYGSFLNSREGPEGGTAPGAAGTMPHGGPSAPQFTVFSGDCVS